MAAMEVRAKRSVKTLDKAKKKKIGYLQQLKDELKKVTWTSKEELALCTKIVLGVTFAFGIGIYLVDLLIKGALDGFKAIFFWIAG